MELVAPFRHLQGMETAISFFGYLGLGIAALVMIATGIFSIMSTLWGDLLEARQSPAPVGADLAEAA